MFSGGIVSKRSGKLRVIIMKGKSFFWTALIIGAEYCAASIMAAFHVIKVGLELGPEDGDAMPPLFALFVIASAWMFVTVILYVLAIWIARWRILRLPRIFIVVILQLPLFATAGFVAIGLWCNLKGWETIAAAFIYSVVVLQTPMLFSRLTESTRS
ncbi:hypothetical protein AUC61_05645 [Pseudomonas sp. S25]|uniref:Uncharacterized protein n=1 Tax=Pseudomonas maioricensis TaxID=1766623 RepID=A0ABS9ZFB3_9PSED|nr:hypothetical protein [Pseudomonas sp. S25]